VHFRCGLGGTQVKFSTIKAINTPASDKDSWSFKGATNIDYVKLLADSGVEMNLSGSTDGWVGLGRLDNVIFDADECKTIRRGTGVMCKTDGARITATKVGT
jgi:hypothetical protein